MLAPHRHPMRFAHDLHSTAADAAPSFYPVVSSFPAVLDVPPAFGPPGWRISGGDAQAGGLPSERFISSIGVL